MDRLPRRLLSNRPVVGGLNRDPDLDHQHLSAARALGELNRIRRVQLTANDNNIDLTTRRTPIQARALTAIGTDTRSWDKATIT